MFVKICGVTSIDDALRAVAAGADAVGVNLVAGSKRRVEPELGGRIAEAVGPSALVVAVVADLSLEAARGLVNLGFGALQLHGDEPPELLAALLPGAYKAIRIGGAEDVALADRYAGERLLVDAKVKGALGGTGARFDWRLVTELARRRQLIVAGGLDAQSVGDAVRQVRPWGVDVASGVETHDNPRKKDPARMAAFVRAARSA